MNLIGPHIIKLGHRRVAVLEGESWVHQSIPVIGVAKITYAHVAAIKVRDMVSEKFNQQLNLQPTESHW